MTSDKFPKFDKAVCLAATEMQSIKKTAFLNLETIDDFHDAVCLILSGIPTAIRPIYGSFFGFAKPPATIAVYSVRDPLDEIIKTPRRGWVVRANSGSPNHIAKAFCELLECKSREKSLTIDLTAVLTDNRQTVAEAFVGFSNVLASRSERLLTQTDIIDLLGWVGAISPRTPVSIFTDYGSSEWGAIMRRDTAWKSYGLDIFRKQQHFVAPVGTDFPRMLACWREPSRDDLDKIFSNGIIDGREFGIVNMQNVQKRLAGAVGMSSDLSLVLPNHGIASISYIATDEYTTAMHCGGRLVYSTGIDFPDLKQDVWWQNADYYRSCAAIIDTHDLDVLLHSNYGAVKMADAIGILRPKNISVGVVGDWLDKYITAARKSDHNAQCFVEYVDTDAPGIVDWIIDNWFEFVGVRFRCKRNG